MMNLRIVAGVLLILNAVVLLGQAWPEGAPPFARTVNIAVLAANVVFFVSRIAARTPR